MGCVGTGRGSWRTQREGKGLERARCCGQLGHRCRQPGGAPSVGSCPLHQSLLLCNVLHTFSLSQFLEEQQSVLLAQLEKLDGDILRQRDAFDVLVSEEICRFSSLISELPLGVL